MTIDERLDRLTGVVESLAASIASRRERIKNLLTGIDERQSEQED